MERHLVDTSIDSAVKGSSIENFSVNKNVIIISNQDWN
jgi:hypothetical protein